MLGIGIKIGFVWETVADTWRQGWAEFHKAFEFVDGSAIVALGLGLVAEEEAPSGGVLHIHLVKAMREEVAVRLDVGGVVVEFLVERDVGHLVVAIGEDSVERRGAEAGFETGNSEQRVLGKGNAFDGE